MKDEEEQLYMVCDDTNNVSLDEIDLNTLPPGVLEEMRKAFLDEEPHCNVA